LTRFVETILDLSALDAGRLPLYPAPVAYDTIVSGLQNQLMHLPGLERIRWQTSPDLHFLLVDERAMTSVLFHLLDNAMKYAPEGDITVLADAQDGEARIRVCDSGPGIPADALPLLFDRFFRSNNADSQTVYGHGLGLYIVRRLLEGMGGRVEVANRPEGGAVFTCYLKLAEEAYEENHATQNPSGG
jgi:signal transduction histidine kinase